MMRLIIILFCSLTMFAEENIESLLLKKKEDIEKNNSLKNMTIPPQLDYSNSKLQAETMYLYKGKYLLYFNFYNEVIKITCNKKTWYWDPIASIIKEKGMKFLLKQDMKFFLEIIFLDLDDEMPIKIQEDDKTVQYQVFNGPTCKRDIDYYLTFDKETKKLLEIKATKGIPLLINF